MTTDIYTISGADSREAALRGLQKTSAFAGMDRPTIARVHRLALALLAVADGLDQVLATRLWLETKSKQAIVHLQADCVIDLEEEEALKKLSSTGENTERQSLFAKIKGAFDELAIADNEELRTTGYIPELEYGAGTYPEMWTLGSAPLAAPHEDSWNDTAADAVRQLADCVDVGYSSERVEIAGHIRYQ